MTPDLGNNMKVASNKQKIPFPLRERGHAWHEKQGRNATLLLLFILVVLTFRCYTSSVTECATTFEQKQVAVPLRKAEIVRTKKLDTTQRYLSVVLRTWHKDAAMALTGLESVVKVIDKNLIELIIVTDQDSEAVVRADLYDPAIEKFPELEQNGMISLRVEPMILRNGHLQQKYSKMTADTYTRGEYILHIDSDCVITQWKDECFLEYGRPINEYATFESLPDVGVGVWKEGTEVFLGIEDEKFEFSRLNQHVYPRELYLILRKRAEDLHGVPFLEIFRKLNIVGTMNDKKKIGINSTLLVSDFNLLGATAYHFAPDLMISRDMTDGKSPWRPFCVAQCNARTSGVACCDKWLKRQILMAKMGKPTSAHMDCKNDFAPEDPCNCAKKN